MSKNSSSVRRPRFSIPFSFTFAKMEVDVYKRQGGKVFAFRSYAKLIFSANEMPVNLDEKSDAFYRRMLSIEVMQKGEDIPDLKEGLAYSMPGFIRECMAALTSLYTTRDVYKRQTLCHCSSWRTGVWFSEKAGACRSACLKSRRQCGRENADADRDF